MRSSLPDCVSLSGGVAAHGDPVERPGVGRVEGPFPADRSGSVRDRSSVEQPPPNVPRSLLDLRVAPGATPIGCASERVPPSNTPAARSCSIVTIGSARSSLRIVLRPLLVRGRDQLAAMAGRRVRRGCGVDPLETSTHRDGCAPILPPRANGGPDGYGRNQRISHALRGVGQRGSCHPPPRLHLPLRHLDAGHRSVGGGPPLHSARLPRCRRERSADRRIHDAHLRARYNRARGSPRTRPLLVHRS